MLHSSTWHNFEHILADKCYWANFHRCKWPNIEQTSDHLVTLLFTLFMGSVAAERHQTHVQRSEANKKLLILMQNMCLQKDNNIFPKKKENYTYSHKQLKRSEKEQKGFYYTAYSYLYRGSGKTRYQRFLSSVFLLVHEANA